MGGLFLCHSHYIILRHAHETPRYLKPFPPPRVLVHFGGYVPTCATQSSKTSNWDFLCAGRNIDEKLLNYVEIAINQSIYHHTHTQQVTRMWLGSVDDFKSGLVKDWVPQNDWLTTLTSLSAADPKKKACPVTYHTILKWETHITNPTIIDGSPNIIG